MSSDTPGSPAYRDQSTQPAVAYSTSWTLRYGPSWNTVVRMHSVLNSPITHSMRALSNAHLPIRSRA
jgi:hypothetical protein